MATSPVSPVWRALLRTAATLALLLALLLPAAAEDTPGAEAPPQAAHVGTKLAFSGEASFTEIGPLGEEPFQLDLRVHNPHDEAIELQGGDLLLCHQGGWLAPLEPTALDGSLFRGSLLLAAGEQRTLVKQAYVARTPATHVILLVDAADGAGQVSIPILRKGHGAPAGCRRVEPFDVGVAGPLEAVPFSDGTTALLLVGQHQVLAAQRPGDVVTSVSVGSDKGVTERVIWKGLGAKGDRRALWPFAQRIEVFEGFEGGTLRLSTRAVVNGSKTTATLDWPVRKTAPTVVRAPVLGRWQLSNGPGQADMHDDYTSPLSRYAYDMVVIKQGRTHSGDPHDNASYYAWNRSVRAVADGRIVDTCDLERDNPGYRGSLSMCRNNRVVIRHADGLYTAYLHIRKRSVPQGLNVKDAVVKAGQVIGRVGNSGESSEPHLHFMAFRIDASGRARAVPVAFSNAWHDAKARRPVVGVPLAGAEYYFRNVK